MGAETPRIANDRKGHLQAVSSLLFFDGQIVFIGGRGRALNSVGKVDIRKYVKAQIN